MTAAIVAIIVLSAACAWLAWRWWSRRQQDAAAARGWDRARAQETAVVEQAQADEAAAVERIEAARDEALAGDRDAVVAEGLRRARERYRARWQDRPPAVECSCVSVGECDDQGTVACACRGDCWGCSCDGRRTCECPDCANACDVVDRAGKRCMRPSVAVADGGGEQLCERCLMGAIGFDEDGNPGDFDA